MTEDKKHQLDELAVSDIVSYLGTRAFSMEECIRMQNKQLAKAKEIIRDLIFDLAAIDVEQAKELDSVKKAKQFFREMK